MQLKNEPFGFMLITIMLIIIQNNFHEVYCYSHSVVYAVRQIRYTILSRFPLNDRDEFPMNYRFSTRNKCLVISSHQLRIV